MIFKLWNEGMTSNNIAKELGVTRNSVMGTIHRAQKRGEDLMKHFSDVGKPKPRITKPVKPKVELRKDDRGRTAVVAKPRSMARDFETLFPVTENVKDGVGILDLGLFSCRYIVDGEGMGAVYCGKRTAKKVYCADHYRICYTPVPARKTGRIHALPR